MDILELAREVDMHPGRLETLLDAAAGLLRASRENIRPASSSVSIRCSAEFPHHLSPKR